MWLSLIIYVASYLVFELLHTNLNFDSGFPSLFLWCMSYVIETVLLIGAFSCLSCELSRCLRISLCSDLILSYLLPADNHLKKCCLTS